ncbi:MAG: efflux RND transporter periplasmic adaptor subunit [Magnetococcales bacterium]|nr:efflux RND transporter periplasmic adaptor subunit [Magnetococcales bacterium]
MAAVLLTAAVMNLSSAIGKEGQAPIAPEIRGHVTPKRFTVLSAEVAAKIETIAAREGERFKEGQTLISFDCSIYKAQMDRARAISGSADRVLASHRRLVELKSAGQLEVEMAALEAAKARGDMLVIQATLSKCVIQAPFTGKVAEQKAREQQFVQQGQALLDILDDSQLEFEFIAPSSWMNKIPVGHTFQLFCEETNKNYPARVARMGAKIDPVSQSMKVMAEIQGHFPELTAGMSGRIVLTAP